MEPRSRIDIGPPFPEGVSVGPYHRSCVHLAACSEAIRTCLIRCTDGRPNSDALMAALTHFTVTLSQYSAFYFELRLRLRTLPHVVRALVAVGNAVLSHLDVISLSSTATAFATETSISAHWRAALLSALDGVGHASAAPLLCDTTATASVADATVLWVDVASKTGALRDRLDLAWLLEMVGQRASMSKPAQHRLRWKSVLTRSPHFVRNAAITQRAYPTVSPLYLAHHALVVGGGFADHVPVAEDSDVGGIYVWNTRTSVFRNVTPTTFGAAEEGEDGAHPTLNLPQRTMATLDGRVFFLIGDCLRADWRVYRIVAKDSSHAAEATSSTATEPPAPTAAVSDADDAAMTQQGEEAPHASSVVDVVVDVHPMMLSFVNCNALPSYYYCHTTVALPSASDHERTDRTGSACGVLLSFGGVIDTMATNALFALDVEQGIWTRIVPESREPAASPPSRLYHVACAVGHTQMYVFGGAPDVKTTTDQDQVYGDLWRYDMHVNRWACIGAHGDVPSPRGSAAFHHIDSYLYLYGGFDGKRSLGDMFRYDLHSGLWLCIGRVASPGFPFWGAGSCLTSDQHTIAIVGGLTPQGVRGYAAADGVLLLSVHPATLKQAAARWLQCATPVGYLEK